MPLHTTEVVQCHICEEYSRLEQLIGTIIRKGKKWGEKEVAVQEGKVIGKCPHCEAVLTTEQIF